MKLLKVYISAFCMCSLSVLLNSCDDFLKEEPLDMKSSDQFWKTKADAESGVTHCILVVYLIYTTLM